MILLYVFLFQLVSPLLHACCCAPLFALDQNLATQKPSTSTIEQSDNNAKQNANAAKRLSLNSLAAILFGRRNLHQAASGRRACWCYL
jgi:hypothetical protein